MLNLAAQTRTELSAVEEELRRIGYRGHVYIARGCPVIMTATTMNPDPHVSPIAIGPEPMERALLSALGTRKAPEGWLADDPETARHGTPPPVVWNTRDLVVTGVTATHALITALHQPEDYTANELQALATKAQTRSKAEVRTAFLNATNKLLPQDADRWLPQLPEKTQTTNRGKPVRPPRSPGTQQDSKTMTVLQELAMDIASGLDKTSTLRLLMRGIPREAIHMKPAGRKRVIDLEPQLTGTKWDPFLATMAEHVAWLHQEEIPAWVHHPERFADPPFNHVVLGYADSLWSGPATFIRHGTLADPRDLDARGGEHVDWTRRHEDTRQRAALRAARKTE